MAPPAQAQPVLFIPQPRIPDSTRYREFVGEFLGRNVKWNSPKGGGQEFPPIKAKPNDQSNWDESQWVHKSYRGPQESVYNKKRCQKLFLLNDADMADLCYMKSPIPGRPKTHVEHNYLMEDVEWRAWEKYGGPQGLAAAKKLADEKKRDKRNAMYATPSPKKQPSQ